MNTPFASTHSCFHPVESANDWQRRTRCSNRCVFSTSISMHPPQDTKTSRRIDPQPGSIRRSGGYSRVFQANPWPTKRIDLSQLFPYLPKIADYPLESINSREARFGAPFVIPAEPAAHTVLARDVGIGHMYDLVDQAHLASQADAIFFIPKVSPL